MKKYKVNSSTGFSVIASINNLQTAQMTLAPGATTGGPRNNHKKSDQWLFVIEGKGEAVVQDKVIKLSKSDLLLIEAKENHEIKNTGKDKLVTLNFYSPPEY